MTMDQALPRNTPEAHGIPSSAVLAFTDAVEAQGLGLHSLMLVRHGQVVAEGWWRPYGPEHPHMLFSLSKSFTSTAVGLAVAEGRLSVDDPVLGFFPEEAPAEISAHLAAMRVRHLLSMSTGHAEDTTEHLFRDPEGNWARAFLARPVEYAPGTHFLYNSGASYMLSAIVQRLTGQTLLDYLRPRLLEPLGIEGATWDTCPRGVNTGGWGLSIKTEDIARFGQLYLQKGLWHGRRLVPEAWVLEATAAQVANGTNPESDWEQGYGFHFWRCRHGAYRGDGAFGQFCVVMPAQDAVLAITAGLDDMQAVLNLVWAHLLPAMGPVPLPQDEAAHHALRDRLAALTIPLVRGERSSSRAAQVSGRAYIFPPNEQQLAALSLERAGDAWALVLRDAQGEHRIACGSGAWLRGTVRLVDGAPRRVAASGAWTAEDTFTARLCLYETPFCPTIVCRFEGDQVRYDLKGSLGFGPAERPQLVGRAAQ